jgi:hypothetical protein
MRRWRLIAIILLAGCTAQRPQGRQLRWLTDFGAAPAGMIALTDPLYCDVAEVTNLDWLEYEFWVMEVFGKGSPEHNAVLPDTSVWEQRYAYGEPYRSSYLRHPAYKDYPVVGVTQEQAIGYSHWRTDRVMWYYLVSAGIIPFRAQESPEDHFTIERFYATDSLKAHHHLPYPSYTLPTPAEWRVALAKADSLARENLRKCKKPKTREFRGGLFVECSDLLRDGAFVINCGKAGGYSGERTAPTCCSRCEGKLIWQLRGNVAELSSDPALVLGGGWMDPLDSVLLDQPFPNKAPNAATGFRNVCRWREWDGVRR